MEHVQISFNALIYLENFEVQNIHGLRCTECCNMVTVNSLIFLLPAAEHHTILSFMDQSFFIVDRIWVVNCAFHSNFFLCSLGSFTIYLAGFIYVVYVIKCESDNLFLILASMLSGMLHTVRLLCVL